MENPDSTLRSKLENDSDLRRKIIVASALAASKVLKDAGVDSFPVDPNDPPIDIATLLGNNPNIQMDTLHDVATGVGAVATVVTLTGF